MRRKKVAALERRLDAVAALVDRIDRNVERIEIATVVREPNTALSADAYDGLRKQVIAATGERSAHLHQLAQFDVALRAGATADELRKLVGEWLQQGSLQVVDDPAVEQAFEFVGPSEATGRRVANPAYVDAATGRVVKAGVVERTTADAEVEPAAVDAAPAEEVAP